MAFRQRGAKLMVSYGGKIQRCPGGGGGHERYVGGEHRLVEVSRNATLMDLRSRLAAVSGFVADFSIRYGFSGEAQDALRRVTTEDDVRCMLDWVLHRDLRVHVLGKDPAMIRRLRVFLVRADDLPPLIDLDTVIAPSPVKWSATATPPPSLSEQPPLIDLDTVIAPAPVQWSATPPPSFSAKPPLPPKRIPSAPSLSTTSTADTTLSQPPPFSPAPSNRIAPAAALSMASSSDPTPSSKAPPHPTLRRRVASAPSLSATSTAAAAASSTSSVAAPSCTMAAFHAHQRIMASPAAVFLVPAAPPVIVYQPVFVVPAFSCSIAALGIV